MGKTIFNGLLAAAVLLGLASCADANKEKCEQAVKDYLTAVSEDDLSTLYELYPESKDYSTHTQSAFCTITKETVTTPAKDTFSEETSETKVTKTFNLDLTNIKVNVAYDENDSLYTATLESGEEFRLRVAGDTVTIVNSRGVLRLDDDCLGLAKATGVPFRKMNDLELAQLMSDDGVDMSDYCMSLSKGPDIGPLQELSGFYNWQKMGYYSSCTIHVPVKNFREKKVKGSDYRVTAHISTHNLSDKIKTTSGVDLEPGESQELLIDASEFYSDAYNHTFNYWVEISYTEPSPTHRLAKYSTFQGDEYNSYKEWLNSEPVHSNPDDMVLDEAEEE